MNNFDELMGVLDTLQKTSTEAKYVTMQQLDTIANTTEQAVRDFDNIKNKVEKYFTQITPTVERLQKLLSGEVRFSERTISAQLKALQAQIVNQNYQTVSKWLESFKVYADHNAKLIGIVSQNPTKASDLYWTNINNTYAKYMEVLDFINNFLNSIYAFQELQDRCTIATRPTSSMEQGGGSKKAKEKSGKANKNKSKSKPSSAKLKSEPSSAKLKSEPSSAKPKSKPSSAKPKSKPSSAKPKSKPSSAKPKKLSKPSKA